MPIDTVIAELASMYGREYEGETPSVARIGNADIERWRATLAISTEALFELLALRLALGFYRNELSFSFCDRVVNEIHAIMVAAGQNRPDVFWDVYLAFDEGEYVHSEDPDEDPVASYTRPRIAQIVAKYGDRLA